MRAVDTDLPRLRVLSRLKGRAWWATAGGVCAMVAV